MNNIRHKILILSGKGGVGKSSIAANLAVWLSIQGKKVGLLDIDIHGPSIPKLLGLDKQKIYSEKGHIEPLCYDSNLKVMSIGFVLADETNAIIWRGPMKHNVIKQFISEVSWGNLDYLIIDCPPGTGDEPLSIVQLLGEADGAVVVTTPQQLAVADVKKCITFCNQLKLPVLGIIENMAGFLCPHCGKKTDIFKKDGGRILAKQFKIPLLASIPIDPELAAASDTGKPFIKLNNQTPSVIALDNAFKSLLKNNITNTNNLEAQNKMRIAIPITDDKLSSHFGHCEKFAIVETDNNTKKVVNTELLTPPAHEPGALPKWLNGLCVDMVIAGGMGQRAQQLFAQNSIKVVTGASAQSPEELVSAYLQDTLETEDNICDH